MAEHELRALDAVLPAQPGRGVVAKLVRVPMRDERLPRLRLRLLRQCGGVGLLASPGDRPRVAGDAVVVSRSALRVCLAVGAGSVPKLLGRLPRLAQLLAALGLRLAR